MAWSAAKRVPQSCNWGIVESKDGKSSFHKRWEALVNEKLEILKKKWYSQDPPEYPTEELSVMAPDDVLYVGYYAEGVVLKLNDKEDQVTFLTHEMATELGRKLLGKSNPQT